ncbi:hypothetical protein HYI18_12595 [Clostridium botulinum]|uniref:hypothetical protein n=1 Tax=Clostridium botulinum TaxID=1491 RepID=UPI00174D08C9|nr:hypothetical protein [Clostridium botulinum]MBD5639415.1 hypothetical protein [Clostridium botulinum]
MQNKRVPDTKDQLITGNWISLGNHIYINKENRIMKLSNFLDKYIFSQKEEIQNKSVDKEKKKKYCKKFKKGKMDCTRIIWDAR